MKRVIFIFLFDLGLISCVVTVICLLNVYASSDGKDIFVMYQENLNEEVLPIRDIYNNFLGINYTITIPSDFKRGDLKVVPDIFGGVREYKELEAGDSVEVNIKINNESNCSFLYRDNSLVIETEKLKEVTNYKDTIGVGFDQQKIYDIFSPYRVFNSALRDLFQNREITNLTDDDINDLLTKKGYKGIVELDKYYLDYYNAKYKLNIKELGRLPYSVIKEIFDGKTYNYKEKNKTIIELAYNYFYNKVYTVSFLGEVVNEANRQDFSIGSFMQKKRSDTYFKSSISNDGRAMKIEGINLSVSKFYFTDAFKDYDYRGYMEFILNCS